MKRLLLILFFFFVFFLAKQTCANSDTLLGITGRDSLLISFDPYTGTITEVHAQLNPNELYRGLAYDSNHNVLYALSQVDLNLYSIDPFTLEVQHIGNLHTSCGALDIGGLTYNPSNDGFYATLQDVNGDSSELLMVNVDNAEVTGLGIVTDSYCFSPSYSEDDGNIYAFSLYAGEDKTSVVSINPDDGGGPQNLDNVLRCKSL